MNRENLFQKTKFILEEIKECLIHFKTKNDHEFLVADKLIAAEIIRVLAYFYIHQKNSTQSLSFTKELFNYIFQNHQFTEASILEMIKNYLEKNKSEYEDLKSKKIDFPVILNITIQYDTYFQTDKYRLITNYLLQISNWIIKSDGEITKLEEEFLNQYIQVLQNPKISKQNFKRKSFIDELEEIYLRLFKPEDKPKKKNLDNSESEQTEPVIEEMIEPKIPIEELLKELNSYIGLKLVKAEIENLVNLLKIELIRKEKSLPVPDKSLHLVFTGNPGTGKTTIARLLAKILYSLGISKKSAFVETDRSSLVAGYVGQTATKTLEVCKSALGGVLFIDEAYSLAADGENDFGKEAIETLLKFMEDNRNNFIVIVAGYTENMEFFIEQNPGLESRFTRYIEFPDYSPEELILIFEKHTNKCQMRISEKAKLKLESIFKTIYESRDDKFGNGRLARNLFEKSYSLQANRIVKMTNLTDEILSTIEEDDITHP
jgi:SpoVK/Ycf46/Vps4 family AAA+-type ATPase